ncbi:hypothetical protein HRM2_05630 [Desulforapulum autotrophicum HRM2]|uniref:Uncharacterized protein n=1 Tax=Desulforapulum autotrophicum (strain ATCC 43914 / DSM 3382 / VKM B-1955 / HRM2) TaxID=177437 RepID=C0QHW9_DESAH|nr:hypothetical protein HRM2_05630 [Desulforapulum autotrophicum HRM2]
MDQAFQVRADRIAAVVEAGFNPCCRGSGIPGSVGNQPGTDNNHLFQSLLSWIRHSRWLKITGKEGDA